MPFAAIERSLIMSDLMQSLRFPRWLMPMSNKVPDVYAVLACLLLAAVALAALWMMGDLSAVLDRAWHDVRNQ